jgi:Zn-dependent protease
MVRRGGGFRLGTILGVEVTLDPSWFIFGILIAWLLGNSFHTGSPYVSSAAGWLLGAMGAILFLCSVLAHELSHSVVARRKGIPVHRITLFIFGGVAQISEEPHTPGDEVKIALAGPAMSLVLGIVLLGLSALASTTGAKAAEALFLTVGATNLLLAVFNMLPGFPLDGGRVFRATVWHFTGSFTKATKVAAISGRIIGLMLMAAGGFLVLTGNLWDGIWMALIGVFLHQTALGYYRQATLTQPGPKVGDLMTRQPQWVPAATPLDDTLYQAVAATTDRALPVVGPEGWISGLLTAELLESIPREHWGSLSAGQVMIPMQWAMAANPTEPYEAVLARAAMNPAGRFVVLDQGRLVGMLTPAAIGRAPAQQPAPQGG